MELKHPQFVREQLELSALEVWQGPLFAVLLHIVMWVAGLWCIHQIQIWPRGFPAIA